jgi:hypothetical protein
VRKQNLQVLIMMQDTRYNRQPSNCCFDPAASIFHLVGVDIEVARSKIESGDDNESPRKSDGKQRQNPAVQKSRVWQGVIAGKDISSNFLKRPKTGEAIAVAWGKKIKATKYPAVLPMLPSSYMPSI